MATPYGHTTGVTDTPDSDPGSSLDSDSCSGPSGLAGMGNRGPRDGIGCKTSPFPLASLVSQTSKYFRLNSSFSLNCGDAAVIAYDTIIDEVTAVTEV